MTRTATSRFPWFLGSLMAIAIVALPAQAPAMQSAGVSIEVLVGGVPLTEYAARGTHYIEASQGQEYTIRLRNNSARRVAVALSVDGLNSIDAKTTTSSKASKWVLDPWQTITVDGWQVSSHHARRFFFTTEDKSYGEWLGETSNLGVIEAVVFREKRPFYERFLKRESSNRSPVGEAPSAAAPRSQEGARGLEAEAKSADLSDDLAATGIGRRVDNPVRRVKLDLEPRPAAQLRLRYEYRPQLVRLGVLPWLNDRLEQRERADGFTDFDFAPDPFD